jgi:hypothetical protein
VSSGGEEFFISPPSGPSVLRAHTSLPISSTSSSSSCSRYRSRASRSSGHAPVHRPGSSRSTRCARARSRRLAAACAPVAVVPSRWLRASEVVAHRGALGVRHRPQRESALLLERQRRVASRTNTHDSAGRFLALAMGQSQRKDELARHRAGSRRRRACLRSVRRNAVLRARIRGASRPLARGVP